jgi:hypothetical protein
MLKIAIILFVIAAVFGLILIAKVFTNKETPKGAVIAHGLFAATALALVAYYVFTNAQKSPLTSLIVFLIAALGGFAMLALDLSKKAIPKGLAAIHALAAVIGLVLLLVFVIQG